MEITGKEDQLVQDKQQVIRNRIRDTEYCKMISRENEEKREPIFYKKK